MSATTILAAVDSDVIPPLWRIVTKFGYFAGLAAVMGSTIVHVAAVRPALRDGTVEEADRAVLRRRSARVMAWSGVLLLVVLYPQLAGKAARATDGLSFGDALAPSAVWAYLTVPGPDDEWVSPTFLVLVTYVLFALSGVLVVLLFGARFRRRVDRVAAVTAPLIIVAQLVTAIPGSLDGLDADSWTMTVLSYAHPIAACTWVGGIAALVALAAARRRLSEASGLVWARIWRRFSVVAEVCVGIVVVSGLWLGWKSVGSPEQLWETPYGRFLLLKVTLVATLVILGAVNEFVLLPRIARLRAAGDTRSVFAVAVGHFPKVVAIEAVLGTAVLVVVPFLNGSAREQAGGEAEPPATGALFTAVVVLLVLVVAAFFANLKLHSRIDNPAVADPRVPEPEAAA
jgi:copper transport protein